MKYLCDACSRLVDLVAFSIEGDALDFVCPSCGGRSRGGVSLEEPPLEWPGARHRAAGAAPAPAPASVPARSELCPKCAAPRPDAREACVRCGLVFARYNPEDFALPAPLETLWRDLSAHWADLDRHEVFVAACGTGDLLKEAVRRYRFKAEEDPQDAVAARYRDQLIERLMAAASLPLRSEEPPASTRGRRAALLGFLMLGAVALALALLSGRLTAKGP